MRILKIAAFLIILALVVILLIIGKSLLVPLVVAISIWYLINTLSSLIEKIRISGRSFPHLFAIILSSIVMMGIFVGFIDIFLESVNKLADAAPAYQMLIEQMFNQVTLWLGIEDLVPYSQVLEVFNLQNVVVNLGTAISQFAGNLILVIVYVVFLILEKPFFWQKFQAMFEESGHYSHALQTMERINNSIKTYITVKTFVSFLSGLLSYIVLRIIGIDFAEFWAFLIFLMNFIPSLGSIFSNLAVSLFAFIQFQSPSYFFLTFFVIGVVDLFIGNYIDPRLMGRSLNLSPLIVLVSLATWGAVWGVIGMVLSVPITVILMIVLAQFPATRTVAILLSEKGKIVEEES